MGCVNTHRRKSFESFLFNSTCFCHPEFYMTESKQIRSSWIISCPSAKYCYSMTNCQYYLGITLITVCFQYFLLRFYYIYPPCVCAHIHMPQCVRRSEDNCQESLLFFHHVDPRDQTRAIKLCCKCLQPWSHPSGPVQGPHLQLSAYVAYRKYEPLKKQLAFAGTRQGPEQKEGSDGQLVEGDRPEQFEGVGRGFRETS